MNMPLLLLVIALSASSSTGAPDSPSLAPPDCLRAVRLARIAESDGQIERAEQLLAEAVADYPAEILPLQELLRLHREHRLDGSRAEQLRGEIGRRVGDPDYPLAAGSIRFLLREQADDPDLLESLLAGIEVRLKRAANADLSKAKAAVEHLLGRPAEARRSLEPVIAADSPFELIAFAVRLDLELERWQSALELLEPRIDDPIVGPMFGAIYLELLAKTGQTARVMKEIERFEDGEGRLVLSDSGYRSLLKEIAWSLYDAGETGSSESLWRTLLKDSPDDIEARLVLANLFSTEEERREQTELIDRQLREEDDFDQLISMGIEYLAAGDNERAFEALSRVAQAGSNAEAVWFNLGLAASRLERWSETAEAFRRATEINGERADSHSNLGLALWRLERWAEAVGAFEAALRLQPDRTTDYYYLGACLAALGEHKRSAEAMGEYRRLRGDG